MFSLFARGLNAAAWAAVNRLNKYCRYSNIAGVACGGTGRRKPPEKKSPFSPFLAPLTHKPCEKKQMKHTHAHTHTHTHTRRPAGGCKGRMGRECETAQLASHRAGRLQDSQNLASAIFVPRRPWRSSLYSRRCCFCAVGCVTYGVKSRKY